jgi:amino acid permease
VLRTVIVVFTGIMATAIPKFGLFINLTGAFSCTALAFIIPVYMYNKVFAEELTKRRKIAHNFIIFFGSLFGFISFILSLKEIVKAFSVNESIAIKN